jgi:threonine synthase
VSSNRLLYVSTRGRAPAAEFVDILFGGPAPDGGLYVPAEWPRFEPGSIRELRRSSYAELTARVLEPYATGALSFDELAELARLSYAEFEKLAPLREIAQNEYLLELFHGPTLAFKDYALQLLARLLEHFLARRGEHVTLLAATSGDTGSAAIAACAGRAGLDIVVLHPKGRVSEVQRRQMTTFTAANVHNLAIEGTFDDCQDLVKAAFGDAEIGARMRLAAVNSINWVRIAAQVAFYYWAALKLDAPDREIDFAVPTGNFGNVFAGYAARRMGLPIGKLIVGSNRNDVLTRFFRGRGMEIAAVEPSLSPSMDIQVSSNFERLLYDLLDRNGSAVGQAMSEFRRTGRMPLSDRFYARALPLFAAERFSDEETSSWMARIHRESGILLDPHTAIGVAAARTLRADGDRPTVALGTAHPAKFPDAVFRATGVRVEMPKRLEWTMQAPERCLTLPNDKRAFADYLVGVGAQRGGAAVR